MSLCEMQADNAKKRKRAAYPSQKRARGKKPPLHRRVRVKCHR